MKKALNEFKVADNPIKNEPFPFLISNSRNKQRYPNRFRFEEIHCHEDLEFTFVTKGVLHIQTLSGEIQVNENEVIYINKNVGHRLIENPDVVFQSYIFPEELLLNFNKELHNKYVRSISEDSEIDFQIFSNASPVVITIRQLFNYVKDEAEKYTYEIDVLSLLYRIWGEFIKEQTADIGEKSIVSIAQKDRLQNAIDYIHSNCTENIALEDIAKYCFIGKSELFRMFKKAFGMSPYEYLIECKMNKANDLLTNTTLSISEIANKLGYSSQSQFAQQFKKRMGVSATNFRKSASFL